MRFVTASIALALCACASSGADVPRNAADAQLQSGSTAVTAGAPAPDAPQRGAAQQVASGDVDPQTTAVSECGNGVREGQELCDGADCPTACVSAVCVRAELQGSAATCNAQCITTEISACASGDGCCPSGCNYGTDTDCSQSCGDGVVSGAETCEPGSTDHPCPTVCDDQNACTLDKLVGSSQQCSARCSSIPITQPASGDGCCPPGATVGTDADCKAFCGDGVVSAGERCDPTIPGSCPTQAMCDALTMGCHHGVLTGVGCSARCETTLIQAAHDGDQCCPPGATVGTDSDCEPRCGDGVVSAGEECDPNMRDGDYGRCPAVDSDCSLPPSDPCMQGALTGDPRQCTARCTVAPRKAGPRDACCPSGASSLDDPDCAAECGNGIVEDGESCDSGPGSSTPCPTARTCPSEACNARQLVGSGCNATCVEEVVAQRDGDGCCPSDATSSTDSDCHDGVEGYWSECSWPKVYSPGWTETTNLAPPEASRLYGCDGTVAVCMSNECVPTCEPSDTRTPDGWEGYCLGDAHPPIFEIFCGPNDSCPAPRQCIQTAQNARKLCR